MVGGFPLFSLRGGGGGGGVGGVYLNYYYHYYYDDALFLYLVILSWLSQFDNSPRSKIELLEHILVNRSQINIKHRMEKYKYFFIIL